MEQLNIPVFNTTEAYNESLPQISFWKPFITEICNRHELPDTGLELEAGSGSTYPVYLYGDLVIKLFGYVPVWQEAFNREMAAMKALGEDQELLVPELIASGWLFEDQQCWPYIISSRMKGIAWSDGNLHAEQQLLVAADAGRQIARLHKLKPSGIETFFINRPSFVQAAAAQSSLPPHLAAQVAEYISAPVRIDPVFVHGDLFEKHLLTQAGSLTGIIDWGDAMITDRHYELAKLYLSTFGCDKQLLRTFLHAANWPMHRDFAGQAMKYALFNQALTLSRHLTNDTFFQLPRLFRLEEIKTMDELADVLFGSI